MANLDSESPRLSSNSPGGMASEVTPGNPAAYGGGSRGSPETNDKWVLSVICWKVENLSPRFPVRHESFDDDVWAVCGFALSGDMKKDALDNVKKTDIHHRSRLEGGANFHWRWTFEVPPAYQARFAFPELKIQLRSVKKENERIAKARQDLAAAKARNDEEQMMLLQDPDSGAGLPLLESSSALCEGTLALHDLFTAADTNYKLKRDNTKLGEEKPLRLQMRASNADGMQQTEEDKTIMLLTLELACGDKNATASRVNQLVPGRVEDGMKTTSRDPREREMFKRAACGQSMSECTPL